MDFRKVSGQPGFMQAIHIDKTGHVDATHVSQRVTASQVAEIHRSSAKLGERLGLGALDSCAFDIAKDASLILLEADGGCTAVVSAALGDALDARAHELRAALHPRDGSLVVRTMGFAEVRR